MAAAGGTAASHVGESRRLGARAGTVADAGRLNDQNFSGQPSRHRHRQHAHHAPHGGAYARCCVHVALREPCSSPRCADPADRTSRSRRRGSRPSISPVRASASPRSARVSSRSCTSDRHRRAFEHHAVWLAVREAVLQQGGRRGRGERVGAALRRARAGRGAAQSAAGWSDCESRSGAEFGIGPNVTPAGVALAMAGGITFRSGAFECPGDVRRRSLQGRHADQHAHRLQHAGAAMTAVTRWTILAVALLLIEHERLRAESSATASSCWSVAIKGQVARHKNDGSSRRGPWHASGSITWCSLDRAPIPLDSIRRIDKPRDGILDGVLKGASIGLVIPRRVRVPVRRGSRGTDDADICGDWRRDRCRSG